MKKSNISKIIKMFLSARFPSETEEKAVSYTHLDVYKRQERHTPVS